MTARVQTTISFDIPKEHDEAVEFEKLHPDWYKDDSNSISVIFTKIEFCSASPEKNDDN